MKKSHYNSKKKSVDIKDEADLFREQSLRAIRRRKQWSQYLFWALTAFAVVIASFALYLCVLGGVNMLYI